MSWKTIVGLNCTSHEFDRYCHGLTWPSWRPQFIALHNTATPSLAQRPNGFSKTHIDNLVSYYRDEQGWSAGPHLFIDDLQIWVFTPLTVSGVHSPSFNKAAIGVEMLGNFETEEFDSGRGAKVRDNAVSAVATLSAVLGIDPTSMRLHKEDPSTTHDCPGSKVVKERFIQRVADLMRTRHQGEHAIGNRAMTELLREESVVATRATENWGAKGTP